MCKFLSRHPLLWWEQVFGSKEALFEFLIKVKRSSKCHVNFFFKAIHVTFVVSDNVPDILTLRIVPPQQ